MGNIHFVEGLETRLLLAAQTAIADRARFVPSIDLAIVSSSESFGSSAVAGQKGLETLTIQNTSDVRVRGSIGIEFDLNGPDLKLYSLKPTSARRMISLLPGASKAFEFKLSLPKNLPSADGFTLYTAYSTLSGFTDPNTTNNFVDFSDQPISVRGGTGGGSVGYFTFSAFHSIDTSGSARAHTFFESGNVGASPGGDVSYTYTYAFGTGTLQIIDENNTGSDPLATVFFSIAHHAPPKLNGKTITFLPSKAGSQGYGTLVEEGFAVPGLSFNADNVYFRVR